MPANASEVVRITPTLPEWQELCRRCNVFSTEVLEIVAELEQRVEEAPIDGSRYVRRNGAWEVLP